MKFEQENSDDDLSTDDMETSFLKEWPDNEPDANILVVPRHTDDLNQYLEVQPHVAHIYRSKETYASFISKCMLPCVGRKTYRSFETGAKSLEESFTVEDEALCLLVLVNSISKWQDEARWRTDNPEFHTISKKVPDCTQKTFSKSLYTEFNTAGEATERKKTTRHGWSHEGQIIFLLFKKAIALKRSSFSNMEEYRSYVSGKLCRKGKRKARREFTLAEPKEKQYITFIVMTDDMNGCIG